MRVVVDRTKCAGLGLCEAVAPDIFELDAAGDLVLHDEAVTDDRLVDIDAAVEGCPMLALTVER